MDDRYSAPFRALLDTWYVKIVFAWAALLFRTEVHLILACIALLTIDWFTGIMAARRRGEKITSYRMRRTCTKGVDYALFVGAFIVVGNAFPYRLGWAPEWAYGFVAMTELKSVIENVWGERASDVWGQFLAYRRARANGASLIEDTPTAKDRTHPNDWHKLPPDPPAPDDQAPKEEPLP